MKNAHPRYVRLIFAWQRRKYGAELEPARLWGRLPRALLFLTLLYRSIDRKRSPVEPGLRAHFDQQAIVELTALIAFQNMSQQVQCSAGCAGAGFLPTTEAVVNGHGHGGSQKHHDDDKGP